MERDSEDNFAIRTNTHNSLRQFESTGTSTATSQNKPMGIQYQDGPIRHIASTFLQMKLICGGDDRQQIDARRFPFCNICRLIIYDQNGDQYRASGFFISPTCVVTSGHCVFLFGSRWAKKITVIPGSNERTDAPFGEDSSSDLRSVKGWVDDNNNNFDYGAVILRDDSLFRKINQHPFPLKIYHNEQILLNSGYPSDKPFSQWRCEGPATSADTHRIYYEIDTKKGNSGSPVFVRRDDQYYVVGIHSYGDCPNYCISITPEILQRFQEWSGQISHNA